MDSSGSGVLVRNSPRVFIASPVVKSAWSFNLGWMWAGGSYGQLGHGGTKKSSANPDMAPPLTGVPVKSVSCGMGHTIFLVDSDYNASSLPSFEPTEVVSSASSTGKCAAAKEGKRAGPSDAAPAAKKGKKK